MSQLLAPTHTVVDHIPLGRRIADIMQEKGPAYTISAMAKRLDISRETLRLMLKGEREIYKFELENIAKDLKVSPERILQTDVLEKRGRFKQMMIDFKDMEEAPELTDTFLQTALGSIEKSYAMYWKARYFFAVREYQSAHEILLEALSVAWGVLHKYGESELLLRIAGNISITYSFRHDKKALIQLAEQVKEYFEEHPIYSGIIYYSLGRIHRSEGDLDKTLEHYYQYLSYMEKSKEKFQILKARINVARTVYRIGDYKQSLELYENTLELLDLHGDPYFKCGYYKDYCKCFIRLHEFEKARHALAVAVETLKKIKEQNHFYFKLEQELLILLAIVHNDPAYAEKLARGEDFEINYRKLACKFLTDFYEHAGDLERKEMYRNLLRHHHTVLDLILYEKEQDPFYLMSLLELCILVKLYED